MFEKDRSQDPSHQGVQMLGLHWGSPSVKVGKEKDDAPRTGWEVVCRGPGLSLGQEKGEPRRLAAIISPSAR